MAENKHKVYTDKTDEQQILFTASICTKNFYLCFQSQSFHFNDSFLKDYARTAMWLWPCSTNVS